MDMAFAFMVGLLVLHLMCFRMVCGESQSPDGSSSDGESRVRATLLGVLKVPAVDCAPGV